jgi:hypothetical protein
VSRSVRTPATPEATFARRAIAFFEGLTPPRVGRLGVTTLNPYRDPEVRRCVRAFYAKFFADTRERVYLFGINPGRFGAGSSGLMFTDGVALAGQCGIPNKLPRRRELSAEFIERVIARRGGPSAFYRDFFITAVSPLGFTRDGRNCNYYDSPALLGAVEPFVLRTIAAQLAFGAQRNVAIVLGKSRNHAYFAKLNARRRWFRTVVPLEHPRFIMQYRRRSVERYLDRYELVLRDALR